MRCRTCWPVRSRPRRTGRSHADCSTATARRRRRCTRCAAASGSPSRYGAGSASPLPVEVRYDEFTDDILENRLVRAATARLGAMPLRSGEARRGLGWTAGMLDNVSPVEFPRHSVPEVDFDRLNEHYREVVALSRLVLRHSAFESGRGEVRASGFLMDMNKVFQEFVTVALREAIGLSESVFRERQVDSLDVDGRVHLKPDLTWWLGGRCVFVGDAKYKNVTGERVPNADLYQMLAYVTRARSAGRSARLREGRGGHGGPPRPSFRKAAGSGRARPVWRVRRRARQRSATRRQGRHAPRRGAHGAACRVSATPQASLDTRRCSG